MKLKKALFFTALLMSASCSALMAHAGVSTGELLVKATIGGAECSLVNTSESVLDFGEIDIHDLFTMEAQTADDSGIQVLCSPGIDYRIKMGPGKYLSSDNMRRMRLGESYIQYAFYTDSSYSMVWTDDKYIEAKGDGTVQKFKVYGAIILPPDPQVAGVYADIVNVIVEY